MVAVEVQAMLRFLAGYLNFGAGLVLAAGAAQALLTRGYKPGVAELVAPLGLLLLLLGVGIGRRSKAAALAAAAEDFVLLLLSVYGMVRLGPQFDALGACMVVYFAAAACLSFLTFSSMRAEAEAVGGGAAG